jgi:hypothetical protein
MILFTSPGNKMTKQSYTDQKVHPSPGFYIFCLLLLFSLLSACNRGSENTASEKKAEEVESEINEDTQKDAQEEAKYLTLEEIPDDEDAKELTPEQIKESKKNIRNALRDFFTSGDVEKIKSHACLDGLNEVDILYFENQMKSYLGGNTLFKTKFIVIPEDSPTPDLSEYGLRWTLKPKMQLLAAIKDKEGNISKEIIALLIGAKDGKLMISVSNVVFPPEVTVDKG